MKKIKIYSNRRDVKQLKRTLDLRERSWKETKKGALKIERLNQKRIKQKKEEEKSGWIEKSFGLKQKRFGLKQNRFGLKKVFLGWKKYFGLKIKGNTPKEKKRGLEKSVGHWSRKESYSFLTVLTNLGYSFLSIFFFFLFG